jgi:DNA-directed RNA polymerase specialized sigma24 family protein
VGEFRTRQIIRLLCSDSNVADHHRARCRDLRREQSLAEIRTGVGGSQPFEPQDHRGLDPADEAVARIEFARLLGVLPADLREVFVMRLDGYTNAQIAAQIGRVERTVELKMRTIRALLRREFHDVLLPSDDRATRT